MMHYVCTTSVIGDDFALCLDVQQHLRGDSQGETDVHKGDLVEEEVHGNVKMLPELTTKKLARFPSIVISYMNRTKSQI